MLGAGSKVVATQKTFTQGHEHGSPVHARIGQDGRVDEDDVGHGQEGGDTGHHLATDVGIQFL